MALSYTSATSSASSPTDFTINIGSSGYTNVDLGTNFAAGSYLCTSSLSDTTLDIYLIASDGTSAGYANSTTASTSITATKAFSTVVVYGSSSNDTLTFALKYIFSPTNVTTNYAAAPRLISLTPSSLSAQNATTVITGQNFASGIAVTFTGTDSVARSAKSITVNSSTQMTVTRPDTLPPDYSPYTITATNPDIAAPTTTNVHKLTSAITVGANPTWVTGTTLPQAFTARAYTTTLSATDADGAMSYSLISGALPTSFSLNSSTGVISGTSAATSNATFTIRATDTGGNYVDRAFTLPLQAVSLAPTSVTATPYSGFALVTWVAPSDAGSTSRTSYTITANPGGLTKSVGASATSGTINGLTNGTLYTFSVQGVNSYGAGTAASATATPAAATLRTTLSSSGTYNLPAGFGGNDAPLYATVYAVGGGGGGGGGESGNYYGSSSRPGGGGGGSGYVSSGALTLTSNVAYNIGGSGTGPGIGTNGNAGGSTVFSNLTAAGGAGGIYGNGSGGAGGAGGSGGGGGQSSGTAGAGGSGGASGATSGGAGGTGSGNANSPGGGGGGGSWVASRGAGGSASNLGGVGGSGGQGGEYGSSSAPIAGSSYGGGGGGGQAGGHYNAAGNALAGQSGGQGVVVVYY